MDNKSSYLTWWLGGLDELITIKHLAYYLPYYIVIIHDVLVLAQRLDVGDQSQKAGVPATSLISWVTLYKLHCLSVSYS